MFITMFTVLILILVIIAMAQSTPEMSLSEGRNTHKSLSGACNDFANAFYKEVSLMENGNIISSPLSIHMILSLLSHGAEAETLNELTACLYHDNVHSIKEEYKGLLSSLNNMKDIKLYIANGIFIQDGTDLVPEFSLISTNMYKSLIMSLNFKNNADAAEKINTWVKKVTMDKISDLVSADDFDEFTKMVLVNGIYFHGHWLHAFNAKDTHKKAFHLTKTEKKFVAMMFKKSKYNYGEMSNLNAKFIEIPYMNEDIVMTVILPNEIDGLQFLHTNFKWEILAKANRSMNEIELYLPKFKFEYTMNLENILRKIGANAMFEDKANFNRMSEIPLKVSKVLHKAIIEVNEEGTEAAAATAVHMRLKRMISLPQQFSVDRPFMFIIEHKPSGLPLFVGSVKDIEIPPERDEL